MAGEDPDYVRRVRARKCAAAGMEGHTCKGAIQAHHAGSRVGRPIVKGGDRRAHDLTCIPLCTQGHTELHASAGPFKTYQKAEKRAWQDEKIAETLAALAFDVTEAAIGVVLPPTTVAIEQIAGGPVAPDGKFFPGQRVVVEAGSGPPTGWRPSSLPIAEHCGLSPALAAAHPEASSRAAAKGIAYHARAAGDPRAAELLDALTADERTEVLALAVPEMPANAARELPLGLTRVGRYSPKGTPGNLTEGTADAAWFDGETAVVIDYKTGVMPIEGGPLSLQLVAYGLAWADKVGASALSLGIWWARRGEWEWSPVLQLDSPEAADLWRRVNIAATNAPIAAPGPWCDGCYQRHRCPARLLPALAGPTAPELAPFIEGGAELTPASALIGLRVVGAMREVADRAEEHIRAAVRGGLVIADGGKVYGPSTCAGRSSADVAALERDGLTQYIRQGRNYDRWGWRRA